MNLNYLLLLILNFLSLTGFASVDTDLNHFFNNLGFSSNTTDFHAYHGQQAGYYTGGSLFARDSVRNVQIAQIDLPKVRSGCGGIDLFTGGFSFINSQNLVSSMQNILNNTAGYAFNLALESATPEIANAMKYMNTIAGEVNRMNINSCETAAGLVGSVWPKTHAAEQQVCQDIRTSQGIVADYAQARMDCSTGGQLNSTLNNAPSAYQSMIFNQGNLAWKALLQNSFLQNDTQLAQFFMSLSGTVIVSQNGSSDAQPQHYQVLPSLADDASLLKALLNGGNAKIYVCDDTTASGCLKPSLQSINIAKDAALKSKVTHLLNDMVSKIYSDSALTDEEKGLLNATRLPIYKMLNVQAAFASNKSVLDIQDDADVIAIDILFQYLEESLALINASSSQLQYPSFMMAGFRRGMDQARDSLQKIEHSAYAQINRTTQLIEQTQNLERMLAGNLSSQMNQNLQWANSLRQ